MLQVLQRNHPCMSDTQYEEIVKNLICESSSDKILKIVSDSFSALCLCIGLGHIITTGIDLFIAWLQRVCKQTFYSRDMKSLRTLNYATCKLNLYDIFQCSFIFLIDFTSRGMFKSLKGIPFFLHFLNRWPFFGTTCPHSIDYLRAGMSFFLKSEILWKWNYWR